MWDFFKTQFKTVDKYLRFLATTGSGYHGTTHVATNADNSLLAAIQAKPVAAEVVLAAALAHHNITSTASVTTAASNVSGVMHTTPSPSVSSAHRYCWAHVITINMWHNITMFHDKRPWHRDEAT
jgi:hypothetical protein